MERSANLVFELMVLSFQTIRAPLVLDVRKVLESGSVEVGVRRQHCRRSLSTTGRRISGVHILNCTDGNPRTFQLLSYAYTFAHITAITGGTQSLSALCLQNCNTWTRQARWRPTRTAHPRLRLASPAVCAALCRSLTGSSSIRFRMI